jgi:site-specific recombinase XerD
VSSDLVVRRPDTLVRSTLGERAHEYARASAAPNTVRTYAGEWQAFEAWCSERGSAALPASGATVADYLAELADRGRAAAGIDVALAAIAKAHKLAGLPSPRRDERVLLVRAGIRRTIGTAQKQKQALLVPELRAAIAALPPHDLAGARDRALILLGFASACRRSELVALDVADVRFVAEGLVIEVRRSKTDQEGAGRLLGVARGLVPETCPVRAVRAWLDAAGLTEGPLFRSVSRWGRLGRRRLSGNTVARIVKQAAAAAGLDPRELAGHSLRSGLATSAAAKGAGERSIQEQLGHASPTMTRRYIRRAKLFTDNPTTGLY